MSFTPGITHPLFTLLVLAAAVGSVWVIDRLFTIPVATDRVQSIDGLRGYLAGMVFIHHACIWYFFLRSGQWEKPASNFYTELGRASVALFFMITAFLFTRRIMASRAIEWNRLYVSRILRIVPLLIVHHLAALLVIAFIRLNHIPTVFNGIDTDRKVLLTAAVSWTLDYEWIFYLMLPLLALVRGTRVPLVLLLLSVLMLVERHTEVLSENMLPFFGGVFAALVAGNGFVRTFSPSRMASLLVVACLAAVYGLGRDLPTAAWLLLLTLAFTLIANGNTLSGLLSCRVSRVFGEITYSVYLLHGLVLFAALRGVVGIPTAQTLSPATHWAVITLATPLLVALSYASWRWIEQPCLRRVDAWSVRLRLSFTPQLA
jgi:peptidoglycan/LPS O-acetylase OafA/YrhL